MGAPVRESAEPFTACESRVRRSFLTEAGQAVDDQVGPVVHLISSWNIDKARDVAWVNVEAMWAIRGILSGATMMFGLFALVVGVIGLARGRVGWARLGSRAAGSAVLVAGLVAMTVGGFAGAAPDKTSRTTRVTPTVAVSESPAPSPSSPAPAATTAPGTTAPTAAPTTTPAPTTTTTTPGNGLTAP